MSKSAKKSPVAAPSPAPLPDPASLAMTAPDDVMRVVVTDEMHEALVALLPRMEKVAPESYVSVRTDIQGASTKARGIALMLRPESSKLAALPDFRMSCIDDVVNASYACTALIGQQLSAEVQSTEAKLAPELEDEANERKSRMLTCVGHFFGKHPVHGDEIASIRSGKGHEDTAHDLRRLSILYSHPEVAAMVTKDPMYYDPHDAPRALVLSKEIFDQLATQKNRQEQVIATQLAQAWTLLSQAWDQIRRAASFLYWDKPAKKDEYPPLFTLGRTARGPAKAPDEPETPAEQTSAPLVVRPVVPPASPSIGQPATGGLR